MSSLLVGCQAAHKDTSSIPQSSDSVKTSLEETNRSLCVSINVIEDDAEVIVEESDNIKLEATKVLAIKDIPPAIEESTVSIRDSSMVINSKANDIIDETKKMKDDSARVEEMTRKVGYLQDLVKELNESVDKLREDSLKKLYSYITAFWVIGFVLLVAGVAGFFFFRKDFGIALGMVGVVVLGFASASHYYLEQIAQVGAFVLVGSFLAAVAMVATSSYKAKSNYKAIAEIIELVEILKETMTKGERERIFGNGGLADRMQSDITKEVVKRVLEHEKLRTVTVEKTEPKSNTDWN
jgi:uncharacterized membrane protein